MSERLDKLMRCVLNDMGDCLAKTREACLCAQMPRDVFEQAQRYFEPEHMSLAERVALHNQMDKLAQELDDENGAT
jgi:hypothetical protein